MKDTISTVLAGMIAASSLVSLSAPAFAQRFHSRDDYVRSYCGRHGGDRDCRDYHRGHRHWDRNRYRDFYRHHHDRNDVGAAALFGLAAGAIIGAAAASNSGSGHVARCEQHYRSYDRRTDSYLGYDGARHACTL